MPLARFFVDVECVPGKSISLEPSATHHAVAVLRLKAGDRVAVIHDGLVWEAELSTVRSKIAQANVICLAAERAGELPQQVTVLQALIKGAKFDDVVEKTVELGAMRIVPVYCERSFGQADALKQARWQRIARSAAEQSRRSKLPQIDPAGAWAGKVDEALLRGRVLVAFEGAGDGSLPVALDKPSVTEHLAIAIGPEGGFTQGEIRIAREMGADIVGLGPTILRTETAAAALLAGIACRNGWW